MKRTFLYAYDRQNLGDDLFIHTITRRYPDVQFYIWSEKKNCRTFAALPNLKVMDKNSKLAQFLHRLRPSFAARYRNRMETRSDAVVYIGGSIFIEYPDWKQITSWWEYEAQNRPFYVLGANFGPYHTEAYREKMAAVFAESCDICFRDQYSFELFQEISTVRHAPDILFFYPMPQVPVKEKQIFVSVINCTGKDENHGLTECDSWYVGNMASLLSRYLDEGYHLVLSSFCKEEGDEAGIDKILVAMGSKNDSRIRKLCYDGTNAAELTAAIAESGLVLASRFHAAILALTAGRPIIPIVYSDKTLHVLQDLRFEGTVIDIRSNEDWDIPAMQEYWRLPENVRTESEKHFEKLDQILK